MMSRRVAVLLVPVLLALALPVARPMASGPQSPPVQDPAQQQPPPVFRIDVDSVSVDVLITDKAGEPVLDLTAADFEVREDGAPQTIETFRLVRAGEDSGPTRASSRNILSSADHVVETARAENRLFVIFLDDYHTKRLNALRIRQQLANFVMTLQPYDLVAVLYPLTPLNGLTFSRNHAATADILMGFDGRKYDYTPLNRYEELLRYQPPQVIERERNRLTMTALEGLTLHLGGMREGRKTVLFVSEGFIGTLPNGVRSLGLMNPSQLLGSGQSTGVDDRLAMINAADMQTQLRYVFSAASRANTAIYTLDPRGLATSEFDVSDNVPYEEDRRTLNETLDTLHQLADETDGRAILNRNDPLPALDQMLRDTSAYYLLSYTSTEAPRDGKFHRIEVKVNRPDIEVRARPGYWAFTEEDVRRATAPPEEGPAADIGQALNQLAAVADAAGRRPVTTYIGARRGQGIEALITLAWEAVGRAESEFETAATVSALVTAGNGDELFRGPVPASPDAIRPSGMVTFEAPPGPAQVRLTVENARGIRIDSDDATLDVPDFTATGPIISTPLIYRGRTARDIRVIREADAPVPVSNRTFSRTERMLLRFDAYGPGGNPPAVTLELLNPQGESLATLPAPTAVGEGQFESVVGLGSLPVGDFLLSVAAEADGTSVRHLVGIRITR